MLCESETWQLVRSEEEGSLGAIRLKPIRASAMPFPGETGDRNVFRLPGYVNLDMGLSKSFDLPWSENHKLQVRFEAFNVTNTQRMGAVTLAVAPDMD